jgi:hypothetical protein
VKKRRDKEAILARFPNLQRWINRCVGCERIGYKPEIPKQVRRSVRLSLLPVNQDGLCRQCEHAKETVKQPV